MGIVPLVVFIGLLIGTTVSVTMNKKLSHPSLWGGIAGYVVFISLSFRSSSNIDPNVVYGLTGIGIAILLHSMYFHKRHRAYFEVEPVDDEIDPTVRQDHLS